MRTTLKTLTLPLLVVFAVQQLADLIGELAVDQLNWLNYLPYVLSPLVLLAAVTFRQSRAFYATVHLTCVYVLLQYSLDATLDQPASYVLYVILTLYFPIMMLLIGLLRERPMLNAAGAFKLFILLAVPCALLFAWYNNALPPLLPQLPLTMLEMAWPEHLVPELSFYLYALSGSLIFFIFLIRKDPTDAALIGGLYATFSAFYQFDQPLIPALFFLTALVTLILALFQTSFRLAYIDELTGLASRRALRRRLLSPGRHYTIAMLDIDHFKKFNDTYGHDVGDQVLRMVAAKISHVSGGGRAFRYGGEEFTVLFSGKSEEQALPHLEALRQAIESYPLKIRAHTRPKKLKKGQKPSSNSNTKQVKVTISIGLSERDSSHAGPADVIKDADVALYRAKKAGRNQVIAFHTAPSRKKAPSGRRHDYARA